MEPKKLTVHLNYRHFQASISPARLQYCCSCSGPPHRQHVHFSHYSGARRSSQPARPSCQQDERSALCTWALPQQSKNALFQASRSGTSFAAWGYLWVPQRQRLSLTPERMLVKTLV